MLTTMIANLDQITPDWLTAALGETFAGRTITSIEQAVNPAFNSRIAHLTVRFAGDLPDLLSTRLLVKLNGEDDGRTEVGFYQAMIALPSAKRARLPMIVTCYGAEYDPTSQHSYLTLADLSDSYEAPISRDQLLAGHGVPTADRLDHIVDVLAAFQAFWWESPQLGRGMAEVRWWYRDETHYQAHVARRQAEWRQFSAAIDWFPADLRTLYEQTLVQLPGLWTGYFKDRVLTRRQMTLSNGDCYLSQFLCPRSGADAPTYLVDFQDVSANFSTYDLVYMFATFWTPEQRHDQDRERQLLERYYQQLQQHGVQNYAWAELWTDYRVMLALMIFDPIWNQIDGSRQTYWWPKLQCLIGAFQDLGCAQLLDELNTH